MAFILNPYDLLLDLHDKDDRKLFKDGCKGLKEKELFDGKKENYGDFVKLLEVECESIRVVECLNIPTAWIAGGTAAARRVPTAAGMIDIFNSNLCTSDQLTAYCDLVWSQSNFGA